MFRRLLRTLLFLVSALAVLGFAFVAARLLATPRVLDPVEGAVLERATRLAHGEALYTEPAGSGEPELMPGFPAAVSLLVRAFGPELWEPRALALLATLLLAALVMLIVQMETSSWTLAVASVGFVLMGHAILADRPGEARPETFMLLLVLLGFLAMRLTNGVWGMLPAALLLSAAFFTDQQAAWFVAAAAFALALGDWKRLVAFMLPTGMLVAGGYVALSQTLGPWFNFNVWDAPLEMMRFSATGPLHYVGEHLLGKLGVPTLAAVMSFALPTEPWRGKGGLWMCMGIGALAAGLLSTQSTAFGPHALIPSVVALSLVGPISIQRVTRHLSAWPGSSRLGGQGVVLAALALQFIVFLSSVSPSQWLVSAFSTPLGPTP